MPGSQVPHHLRPTPRCQQQGEVRNCQRFEGQRGSGHPVPEIQIGREADSCSLSPFQVAPRDYPHHGLHLLRTHPDKVYPQTHFPYLISVSLLLLTVFDFCFKISVFIFVRLLGCP